MTVLKARLRSLAAQTEADVTALWRRHTAGEISESRFVDLAAFAIARANSRAVGIADLAVTASLIRNRREAVPPLGLIPDPVEIDIDRIKGVLRAVLDARPESIRGD